MEKQNNNLDALSGKTHALEDVTFELDGYVIRGITNNNHHAPVVLCLHGWLDNAASFLPVFSWLDDFHLIAIDWPGHGLSDHRSKDAHYHFLDYVYDLLQLFQLNNWREVYIVGHSMGGMIATAFASAFPEKVKSLTLIDAFGFISCDEKEVTKQLRKGLLSRLKLKDKSLSVHPDIDSAVQARVNASDLSAEHAKLIVERGIKTDNSGVSWRSDQRLRAVSPYRLSPVQAEQLLHDLVTPTQLIFGDQGMAFVRDALNKYQSAKRTVESHSITGGHHVHMEQPEACAKLIRLFFCEK